MTVTFRGDSHLNPYLGEVTNKMLYGLARITNGKTGRFSSWDTTGRNDDAWRIPPGNPIELNDEMKAMKARWAKKAGG